MTEVEQTFCETLIELDRAVQSMPKANPKPDLFPLFARLDELAKQLPPEADPESVIFCSAKVTRRHAGCLKAVARRTQREVAGTGKFQNDE